MVLSDGELQDAMESGLLVVTPFLDVDSIQPSSIDLRLDPIVKVQRRAPITGITLDPETLDITDHLDRYTEEIINLGDSGTWEFRSGSFVLGQTLETVGLPLDMAARVEGRSRLARLGVGVHITAPKTDPGFNNPITLEIFNLGPWTIGLRAGMRICTLIVERLGRPARGGYAGIFQGE
jgi:dCTP deaminase